MSGLSLNTNAPEEASSPRSKTRHNSCDDDEPIVIKIKRRDKDGKTITTLCFKLSCAVTKKKKLLTSPLPCPSCVVWQPIMQHSIMWNVMFHLM